ncbi:DEAD/DEAH box helicase [Kineococcus sp. NPDC059986]|uniref:DEAD/DEAH box helicase n=1 Tax=Kineococcus sp. NPDC059986 TaxID=3155538 RepID=UPI00344C839E
MTVGLIDRIRRRRPAEVIEEVSSTPVFDIQYGQYTRFITDRTTLSLMRSGRASRRAQEQFYVLDLLTDEFRASETDDGFTVPEDVLASLDADDAAVLGLPPVFGGALEARVHRWTSSPDFALDLDVLVESLPTAPDRRGPVLQVGGELLRLPHSFLVALRAVERHRAIDVPRSEVDNVRLVAKLQKARELATTEPGSQDFSLCALDRFTTITPKAVALTVEPQPDGSLTVQPDLGRDIDADALTRRWHQLDRRRPETAEAGDVIRVDDTLVLLDGDKLAAVQEVRRRPVIDREDVRAFLQAPGSFYDPAIVDVDIRFSVRVAGLGVLAPVTFNEAMSTGLDWYASVSSTSGTQALVEGVQTLAQQDAVESSVSDAWERGDTVVASDGKVVDVSDRDHVRAVLAASRQRVAALDLQEQEPAQQQAGDERRVTVGMHIVDAVGTAAALRELAAAARPQQPADYTLLQRAPFPHQRAGVEWLSGLLATALDAAQDVPVRIQGALLADDMGLGKTFTTLVALGEVQRVQRAAGRLPLPVLGVMPVALLENWLQEIRTTFGSAHGPFDDVVVLQGSGISHYRLRGASAETAARVEDLDEHGMVREDRIHASLRIGPACGEARLDRPGVLVLTTYETLRRYQVSLGLVDWGVVIFDEAQATKNPEILTTRAAKALKARFKLLATGTPVENSLRDFWTLVDTAQPGLLGSWVEFQETWVTPMTEATPAEHERLGLELREAVGPFMLRRVKEDHLTDLPPKHLHEYRQLMPTAQVQAYDGVIAAHRGRTGLKGAALKTLHELANASLHPGLLAGKLDGDPSSFELSARTLVTVQTVLDGVRAKGEKAIVFAKTKEMQRALALWLCDRYGFRVDIVNGDTAATGRGETRMKKIRDFEAKEGFNVIILSPLAVGVGLTVVGANHAIHLERHWNPAKEAQATDRIHRIGQQREVHVHLPVALHPDVDSFDVNLDRLLRSKVALKDAVVVPQEVTGSELESALGLT